MIDRFEQFFSSISSIYKIIQKIERDEMARFALKGSHVQCMIAMHRHSEGVTVTRLCEMCEKDKAAVSRDIAELEDKGMVRRIVQGDRAYRAPLVLTKKGTATACRVAETIQAAVEMAGQNLSDEDRLVFYRSLDLIAGNLRRISREGIASTGDNERKDEECV